MVKEVARKQSFVAGRRYFGDEYDVVGIAHGLVGAGEIRVDGVAHLMDQREHIIEFALEVEQDHRVHAVAAGRVGATTFARRFVYVNPTLRKAAAHQGQVVFTHGAQRF